MRLRNLNEKYNISRHRFAQLYHFCLQYHEWKDELKYKTDSVGSVKLTGMPSSHNNTSKVENVAIRRSQLEEKCKIIEQTALETDSGIYQYLLKAVTCECISYNYLRTYMGIPCGKNYYYDKRRRFYYLLSQKIF